jgi:ribosomal protein S6--L-glutamate ligase
VNPVPGREDVSVMCVADVVDRRCVVSSNGESERRPVIRTMVAIGGRQWPIEITLANRGSMAYRMLLGRQAIGEDMVVDAQRSFVQPRLSYRSYGARLAAEPSARALEIAILSRRPENAGNRRLVKQAELRGHHISIIDRRRVSLYIAAQDPAIIVNGVPIERLDAVIFRAGKAPSAFSLAIVRQMQMIGAYALNPADALARVGDALVLRQTLAAAGLPVPEIAVNPSDLARKGSGIEHSTADSLGLMRAGTIYRLAVLGGRAVAMVARGPQSALEPEPEWQAIEAGAGDPADVRRVAEAAARASGLGLVSVDIALTKAGPLVVDVTANVSISMFEKLTGAAIAEAIIVHIERAVAARTASGAHAKSN